MTFEEIKRWREQQGLSQSQMADALRVPLRTYQGWEIGRPIPDVVETAISGDFQKRVREAKRKARNKSATPQSGK